MRTKQYLPKFFVPIANHVCIILLCMLQNQLSFLNPLSISDIPDDIANNFVTLKLNIYKYIYITLKTLSNKKFNTLYR